MQRSEGARLGPLTTLRLGGPARELVRCDTAAEIGEVVAEVDRAGAPLFVLGGGSNVVVSDDGFAGTVLAVASRGVSAKRGEGDAVFVFEAGEPWPEVVARLTGEGYAGVECLAGIPGLVGATPMQNVGAYGQDVAQVLEHVEVLDRATGAVSKLGRDACAFGYRTSLLKHARLPSGGLRYVVLRVALRVARASVSRPIAYAELARALSVPMGGAAPLTVVHDTVVELRRGKGMVLDARDPDSVSAGSFFTNPILDAAGAERLAARVRERLGEGAAAPTFADPAGVKVAAAWLIERAGFSKGYSPGGGVAISTKHALALVAREGATARALLALAREIEEGVERAFGVHLDREPVLVGL
ncbi:MAG: UDP-N-acetylmuramate dehydrogenase [Myxococcales bacterium]|jgi:UDP-N-acetylmuramate dehydrogenase|nr:UDP-N-acetylmuramate dehydrogenase [Myxococcales bacterium]